MASSDAKTNDSAPRFGPEFQFRSHVDRLKATVKVPAEIEERCVSLFADLVAAARGTGSCMSYRYVLRRSLCLFGRQDLGEHVQMRFPPDHSWHRKQATLFDSLIDASRHAVKTSA
jgi:hypothetical protein